MLIVIFLYIIILETEYSNLRLLDSINKVEDLIQYAFDLGLEGICITDHETLSAHIRALKFYKDKCEKDERWKSFKLGLGNEIYLCRNGLNADIYEKGEKFPHFILVAKDEIGHRQLRELSTKAWSHSFTMFLTRVPTYYSDIEEVIGSNPGHVVASSACIGGYLGICKSQNREEDALKFINWCVNIFGNDFYLELQPASYQEQIEYNKWLLELSVKLNVKCIVTTDSHYLKKEDREVHSSFLNSKDGDRETSEFYQYTYVMPPQEIIEHMKDYIPLEQIETMFHNTHEINEKIETYDLAKPQIVPRLSDDRNDIDWQQWLDRVKIRSKFEYLNKYLTSLYEDDRYFLYLSLYRLNTLELSPADRDKYLERLEQEATELWLVSEQIKQPLSGYLLTVRNIVKIIWADTNSLVGISRGSAGSLLFNYLIGVTDMNPMTCGLFLDHRRFVHREKPELSDVDIDTEGCRRNFILTKLDEKMKEENGRSLNVATFGTLGTRSAILTAARGLGIDVDIAQYLATMIPQERGFLWPLKDCIYGNPDKDRKPIKQLIEEFHRYPNFLETASAIEGLVCQMGIHASGVCLYNTDIWDYSCSMRAPNGIEVTQWDLHDAEYAGSLKFDLLSIEALDKIHACINMLMEDNQIIWQGDLRSTYLKYLHPDVLEYNAPEMWEMVEQNKIIDLFQMDTTVAKQALKAIKPTSIPELAAINSLMRLMPDKGEATPVEEYVLYKSDPGKLKREIENLVGEKEQKDVLYNFLKEYNGVPSSQESVMYLSMIPELTNFSFGEANKLRKLISKKQMNKIAEFREVFFRKGRENGVSDEILSFIWDKQIKRQLGYSFSDIHTIAYSLIALQEMNLNYKYPMIYWATACLTVNSGGADEENGGTTNYGKLSSAIGRIKTQGIGVELPDINKARLTFTPDVDTNTIIYGLKGISDVGDSIINSIISNRPYSSFRDFMEKVKPAKSQTIALIKAGCFDKLESVMTRKELMYHYIGTLVPPKTRITLQNLSNLASHNLLPKNKSGYLKLYNFNKYLKASEKDGRLFLDDRAYKYYTDHFGMENLCQESKKTFIERNVWEKVYSTKMDELREYLNNNQDKYIQLLHEAEVSDIWENSCQGTLSAWEMESLGFYYHEHELANVSHIEFKFSNFYDLPDTPIPQKYIKYKDRDIPVFKLVNICGTVLDKSSYKHTVILLTPQGVVNVKCVAEQYSQYDKQISRLNKQTKKKEVVEKSWFKRGTKLIISGWRSGNQFLARSRQSEDKFAFYKINDIDDLGQLQITRYRAEDTE